MPEFAARVQRLFDAGRHKTIATLAADGSPGSRVSISSPTAVSLRFDDRRTQGGGPERDPRFALHGPTFHPEGKENEWPARPRSPDERYFGPVTADGANEQADGEMFTADIAEVVVTGLNAEATKLVVESWTLSEAYEGSSGTSISRLTHFARQDH